VDSLKALDPRRPIREADFPILELTSAATLRERGHRGHRGLARRRVAVRRRSIFMLAKGQRPHPRRTYSRGLQHERPHLRTVPNSHAAKPLFL
jgi:hypothetical protein